MARLVAKGLFQKDDVDYDETFAPVVLLEVLFLLVGELIAMGWQPSHLNIWSGNLNSDINRDLYVKWDGVSFKLTIGICEMKQSSRLLYDKWKKALEQFRFGCRNHSSASSSSKTTGSRLSYQFSSMTL